MRNRTASETLLVVLLLVSVIGAVFAGVAGHGFVYLDDDHYVFKNQRVRDGITRAGVAWAFGSMYLANWHPLTWISHMADVELFGLDAGKHHLVNVAFHAANAVLLFLFLLRATGFPWRSALVAALFALHPLHVESVAWVAERKDVLSTFFGFLAMLAYLRFARSHGRAAYVAVLASLA